VFLYHGQDRILEQMSLETLFLTAYEPHSRSLQSIGDHTQHNLLCGSSESRKYHLFYNALLRLTVAAQPPLDTGGMDVSMMIHSIRPGCSPTGVFPEAGAFTPSGVGMNCWPHSTVV
jgi:hypothetical protein